VRAQTRAGGAGTSAVRVEQHAAAGAGLEQVREPACMRALERRDAGAGVEPGTRWRLSVDARWLATRRARRTSCGGKLLREMRERGGIDPDKYTYAPVISGWCKTGRIEDAARVFDEMMAAGEVKPTAVMYNALSRGRRGEGNESHDPNAGRPRPSRRRRGSYGVASRKEKAAKRRRRSGATSSEELGAARHGELPSSMRRSGQE
jgi:pentatricopeptide repeat protein